MLREAAIIDACRAGLAWMTDCRGRGLTDADMVAVAREACGKDHLLAACVIRMLNGQSPSQIAGLTEEPADATA